MNSSAASTNPIPQLNFNIKAADVLPRVMAAITRATQQLDQIGSLPEEACTVESVVEALARQEVEMRFATSAISFLQHASSEKELRDASTEADRLTDEFSIDKATREDLFRAFKALINNLGGDLDGLHYETKRFIEKSMLGFKHAGLDLPVEKRELLKEKMKRLADLETTFSKNMAEDKTRVLFTAEDLEGCTPDFLESLAKETVDSIQYYVATTSYPDVQGISRYAKCPETRKRIDIAFNSRAAINEPVLEEAVRLRAECAALLGYETHADLVLEDRLAKSRKIVLAFEDALRQKLVPLALAELEVLRKFKADDLQVPLSPSLPFNSWDSAYYSRLLLERDFAVDEQEVKQYFEASRVVPEMLKIYEQVLSLKFTSSQEMSRWHGDAMAFEVRDAVDGHEGELVGYFYLDLHPREGKYTHAACFPLIPGFLANSSTGARQIPVAAILANFSKATASRPSLLKHGEVVTLFHELGHAMHGMCAKTRYARFHGTSVERGAAILCVGLNLILFRFC